MHLTTENCAQAVAEINMTITQNHIAEFTALAISIICWKHIRKGSFHWLPFFLAFILCVELAGNYFQSVPYANIILYNFSIPLEYLFYLFLFYIHGGKNLKKITRAGMAIFLSAAIYFMFAWPLKKFHNYVLVVGQVSVIIACCIFLYEKFITAEDISLLSIPFFWLTAGLLLFNLGELSFTLLYPMIKKNGWDELDDMFKAVNNNLLILLYLSYVIAILLYRKRKHIYAGRV